MLRSIYRVEIYNLSVQDAADLYTMLAACQRPRGWHVTSPGVVGLD